MNSGTLIRLRRVLGVRGSNFDNLLPGYTVSQARRTQLTVSPLCILYIYVLCVENSYCHILTYYTIDLQHSDNLKS